MCHAFFRRCNTWVEIWSCLLPFIFKFYTANTNISICLPMQCWNNTKIINYTNYDYFNLTKADNTNLNYALECRFMMLELIFSVCYWTTPIMQRSSICNLRLPRFFFSARKLYPSFWVCPKFKLIWQNRQILPNSVKIKILKYIKI